jgi:hypothetical protein
MTNGLRQPNAVISELWIEQNGPPTNELVDFKLEYLPNENK